VTAGPEARRSGDPSPRIRVHVVDEQSVEQLDLARWRALAGSILNAEALWGPGEATLLFVEIDAMAQLNKIHMGVDGPTDVLSFPIDSDDNLVGFEDRLVGDIVICPAVARANANEHAGLFEDELALLIAHGVLHLLGHDHGERIERELMWKREKELLGEFWGDLPPTAWSESS